MLHHRELAGIGCFEPHDYDEALRRFGMLLKLGEVKNPDVGNRGRKLWHLLYLIKRVSPALFRASLGEDQEECEEHSGNFGRPWLGDTSQRRASR